MKVETPIKPGTRGVGSKPLPAPNSDFYQLADAAVVARSQGLAGTAWGRLAAGSVSSVGEMVDVPASPVRQLPHQRLARSETTSGRLVQVIQDSSLRLFARKTRQKPFQDHALELTGSKNLLAAPPRHGRCFHSSQSRHPTTH
jgi:hypothetical protein